MDTALLHSLLEANCSLALAEELLLDGWGSSLDPEGRREARGQRRRGLLPRRPPCVQGHALSAPGALSPSAPCAPATPLRSALLSPVARSLLLLQHDLGPDRYMLAPERGWSPRGEAVS